MTVSRQTANDATLILCGWAEKYSVPLATVRELLLDLSCVQGNKSYKDTIDLLLCNLPKPVKQHVQSNYISSQD